jgi:2,5-furandicarboxylate decarboxylase 1
MSTSTAKAEASAPRINQPTDLREWLEANSDVLTVVEKPVAIDDIGALTAQSQGPIIFDNIKEYPGYRMCDMLVTRRRDQARCLGVDEGDYLKTLARALRDAPVGYEDVETGPVKEVILTGKDADWTKLPVPWHSDTDGAAYITAAHIIEDPDTGFYNYTHARIMVMGPQRGVISFINRHAPTIMQKYRDRGMKEMPIAVIFGMHPAYEIIGNFSGLHMDSHGELEMAGNLLGYPIPMVPCETVPLRVPSNAEIIVEGHVNLTELFDEGQGPGPALTFIPRVQKMPEMHITAITMRKDRPIYRNHQACPETDHQTLPRLCHEAVIYNRLTEMGITVHDVQFPMWMGAAGVVIQIEHNRPGIVNDALMQTMGSPWMNTKWVIAISPDTDINSPNEVWLAVVTRCDPSRDLFVVPATRGAGFDPSAQPLPDHFPHRLVGKIGIDATVKARHDASDFEVTWPKNWGKVFLKDYL